MPREGQSRRRAFSQASASLVGPRDCSHSRWSEVRLNLPALIGALLGHHVPPNSRECRFCIRSPGLLRKQDDISGGQQRRDPLGPSGVHEGRAVRALDGKRLRDEGSTLILRPDTGLQRLPALFVGVRVLPGVVWMTGRMRSVVWVMAARRVFAGSCPPDGDSSKRARP